MYYLLLLSLATATPDQCGCDLLGRPFPELDRLTGPAREIRVFDWCEFQRAVVLNHDPTQYLALVDSVDWKSADSSCALGSLYVSASKLVHSLLHREVLTQQGLLEDERMQLIRQMWGRHTLAELLQSFWADSVTKLVVLSKAFSKQSSSCPAGPMVARITGHLVEGGSVVMTEDLERLILESARDARCNVEYTMLLMTRIRSSGNGDFSSLSLQINLEEAFFSGQRFFELLDVIRFYEHVQVPLKPTVDWLFPTGPDRSGIYDNQHMHISVFPYREMASEYVRVLKQPLCTTAPFRRIVPKLAASETCPVRHINLVEIGPNLGDCGLWASSLFRLHGKSSHLVFVEALPMATEQIRQSVQTNRISALVYSNAFGANGTASMQLSFLPGRAAQAANIATLPDCVKHKEICSFIDVPTLALDDVVAQHPTLSPIHILKVFAYGEEVNGLLGSAELLRQGEVCVIFLHAMNMKKGFKNEPLYAEKLWDVLAGYQLLHFAQFDPRAPQFTSIAASDDLKRIFLAEDRDITDDFVLALSTSTTCAEFINCLDLL